MNKLIPVLIIVLAALILLSGCVTTDDGSDSNQTNNSSDISTGTPKCYQHITPSGLKNWCAKVNEKSQFCSDSKDMCHEWLSGKSVDVSSCENSILTDKGFCYGGIAATLRDTRICDITSNKDTCLLEMATNLGDSNICNLISAPTTKENCYENSQN